MQELLDFMQKILNSIADFFIMLINFLIAGVGIVLSWIVSLLPDSPFRNVAAAPGSIDLGFISWLIPFPDMIKHTLLLCSAALVYYSLRVLARWIKISRG